MESYERMTSLLKAMKLYRLDGKGLIEAELYAYGKILSALENQIRALGKDCFLDELESQGSSQWERLFGFPQTPFPMSEEEREKRKDKIGRMKKRLELSGEDFHLEGIKRYLESIGISASITENDRDGSLTVTILEDRNYFTKSDRMKLLREIFPAGKIFSVKE
jgi:hypothetical protein